ncbi:ATP-dependent DNA helicase RecG [Marinobacterium lutimaris]|uniref:ATP-dependent DNA helicase RecG n=1 Tax=Marinobacterium lutimaris TaxID=568106 RepID=A0A1H6D155_9GAMM|nr:ATP-dependent DNA helicase RecG [Marinobacterium lutimaris]SEG79032.1 ATP-dependent DNA helicase RecG [Marinobacterium lutimaris]
MLSVSAKPVPITELKGVGTALALKLERLGLETIQDLLLHLPLRYQDRTRVLPIGSLRPGDEGVIVGHIAASDITYGRRKALMCRVQDGTGSITLRFFHFSAAQKNSLAQGKRIRCFGEARPGPASLEMVHPEYKVIADEGSVRVDDALTPVYPLTEGLTQGRIRGLVEQALGWLDKGIVEDLLPDNLRQQWQLPELTESIRYLHQPPVAADQEQMLEGKHPAQQRLAFEELLAHHLSLLKIRQKVQEQGAPLLKATGKLSLPFIASLPFELTQAQRRVAREVARDMTLPVPMLRLVQGDVGSGKTVVAALAAIQALENGAQAAVMAPTEILAEQHYNNFSAWLEPLGVSVAWLAGKVKGKQRARELERIANGEAQLAVGTHALFQEEVRFHNLAVVVVDEQHRFGVHQRLSLREKGCNGEQTPHQLIMTATPIPRTLTMSAYADLDCSIIDELPPGRTPVNTVVIADGRRDEVIARVRSACSEGRQAYWVCTLIEESEALQCQAAEVTAESLRETLPELRIGLVHGRLKAAEKAQIMASFKAAELDLLVATTVIEVGVDVPNASLMIIENPERLGLAQLHQLRGRVGRGSVESFCVLMYHAPLSQQGRERLAVMRESTDGFRIAEKDLELRGPGEVLGTRQTGMMQFRIADLQRDAHLLPRVKRAAADIEQAPALMDALIRRWLGQGEAYARV